MRGSPLESVSVPRRNRREMGKQRTAVHDGRGKWESQKAAEMVYSSTIIIKYMKIL